jgi:hypothetical protein
MLIPHGMVEEFSVCNWRAGIVGADLLALSVHCMQLFYNLSDHPGHKAGNSYGL